MKFSRPWTAALLPSVQLALGQTSRELIRLRLVDIAYPIAEFVITIGIPYCPTTGISLFGSMSPSKSDLITSPTSQPMTLASTTSAVTPIQSKSVYIDQNGQKYLIQNNTGLAGNTIEPVGPKKRQSTNLVKTNGTFEECLISCDANSACEAINYLGSTCILYAAVVGTIYLLGGEAAYNLGRFEGFTTATPAGTSPGRQQRTDSVSSTSSDSAPTSTSTQAVTSASENPSLAISPSSNEVWTSSVAGVPTITTVASFEFIASSSALLISSGGSSTVSVDSVTILGASMLYWPTSSMPSNPVYRTTSSLVTSSYDSLTSSSLFPTLTSSYNPSTIQAKTSSSVPLPFSTVSSTLGITTPSSTSTSPSVASLTIPPPSPMQSSSLSSLTMSSSLSALEASSSPALSALNTSSVQPSTVSPTSSAANVPSATPVRNTGKRGLVYTNDSYTTPYSLSGQNSQVSWSYDYFYSRYTGNDSISNLALTFVPLMFSDASDLGAVWPAKAQAAIDAGADALMSFNEPDLCISGSACMTVNQSVEGFKKYFQPFAGQVKLGAPAVTNQGSPGGLTYLSYFMGNCTDCTIDFIAVHWYSNKYAGLPYLQSFLEQAYHMFGLPIWLTEFGLDYSAGTPTDVDVQAFLKQALPWLDAAPFVERYAYFYDGPGYLINANGSGLSAQGLIYNSYTMACANWNNSAGHC